MTTSAVAARYANAFADVITARTSGVTPEIALAEVRAFEGLMRSSAELSNALTTPAVAPPRKRAVVGKLAERLGLSRLSRNFLFVLLDHRRIASLGQIIQTLEQVLDERMGFARVEIAAARELSDDQRRAIELQLARITGRRIRMQFSVDESLIGGAIARVGSTIYDGSVRGQLHTLARRMAAGETAAS